MQTAVDATTGSGVLTHIGGTPTTDEVVVAIIDNLGLSETCNTAVARLLLALATGRPMGAYNTVPEAARGVLSYVQRQCAELDAARAEIEQLRAVADARATSSGRAGGPTS